MKIHASLIQQKCVEALTGKVVASHQDTTKEDQNGGQDRDFHWLVSQWYSSEATREGEDPCLYLKYVGAIVYDQVVGS